MTARSPLSPALRARIAGSFRGAQQALTAPNASLWVTVVGGSMAPHLGIGARVRIRRCGYLWPGDVALLKTPAGEPLLHRVVIEMPCFARVVHGGDAGGRLGVAHRSRVVGRADVTRKAPSARQLQQLTRLLSAALVRRLKRPRGPRAAGGRAAAGLD